MCVNDIYTTYTRLYLMKDNIYETMHTRSSIRYVCVWYSHSGNYWRPGRTVNPFVTAGSFFLRNLVPKRWDKKKAPMHRCGFGSLKRRLRADATDVNDSRNGSTLIFIDGCLFFDERVHKDIYMYIYIYTYIQTYMMTVFFFNERVHKDIYIYMYIYIINKYIYIYIYIYMCK